jgi:hypothetical protein
LPLPVSLERERERERERESLQAGSQLTVGSSRGRGQFANPEEERPSLEAATRQRLVKAEKS